MINADTTKIYVEKVPCQIWGGQTMFTIINLFFYKDAFSKYKSVLNFLADKNRKPCKRLQSSPNQNR